MQSIQSMMYTAVCSCWPAACDSQSIQRMIIGVGKTFKMGGGGGGTLYFPSAHADVDIHVHLLALRSHAFSCFPGPARPEKYSLVATLVINIGVQISVTLAPR